MMLLWTLILETVCVRMDGYIPQPNNKESFNMFQGRVKADVIGGFQTCFLTEFIVQNKNFLLQIDTGSSDTVLPITGINAYKGPTVDYTVPSSAVISTSTYGDGSSWKGFGVMLPLTVPNTILNISVPVGIATSQSESPQFMDGDPINGLLGIGFDSLSQFDNFNPKTMMDTWAANKLIRNEVSFHSCPYSSKSKSWIDFGNDTPFTECGNQSVTISVPYKSYFTLNLIGIEILGKSQPFPTRFQSTSSNTAGRSWSILDSCTSVILLPSSIQSAFAASIKASGGFSTSLTSDANFDKFLTGRVSVKIPSSDIKWSKFPTLGFRITSNIGEVLLVLGPKQYLQYDTAGYLNFLVVTGDDKYAILGLPIFSAYHITLNRADGTITFRLGCDCSLSTDGYPMIVGKDVNITTGIVPPNNSVWMSTNPNWILISISIMASFLLV